MPLNPTLSFTIDANLRRLFWLRNFTIIAELFALTIATQWLDLPLPLLPLGILISGLVCLNITTYVRMHRGGRSSHNELFAQLTTDVVIFSGILYFTGGATNPFAWFFLIPLIIAATLLPHKHTWALAVLCISAYTLLLSTFSPLQGDMSMHHHANSMDGDGFSQHIFGMWFGFVLSATIVAHFVVDMAQTLRDRDRHIADAREKALRNERIVALGTLAAGAAHELGTPLGTMAIVTGELLEDTDSKENPDLYAQLLLIRDQVRRCKEALSVMSASAGEQRAESGHRVDPGLYLHDVITAWQALRPDAKVTFTLPSGPVPSELIADQTVGYALTNVFNNAADASPEHVDIAVHWEPDRAIINVTDQGDGIAPDITDIGNTPASTKEHGMGVGLFLAHATINRLGGNITHQAGSHQGTVTRIELPLVQTT